MTAPAPVLILGGYGGVGRRIARMLRRLQPQLPVTIAGRHLDQATAVAEAVGHASAAAIDLSRDDLGLPVDARYSVLVTALRDLSLITLRYAQARGVPYVALSDGVFEIGPTVVQFARHAAAAPVVLLGHSMGGAPMMAALARAAEFDQIDSVEISALFDPDDPFGPGSAADMERIGQTGPAPLGLDDGRWRWLGPADAVRRFRSVSGHLHDGQAVGLLDVLGLATLGAHDVRLQLATGPTATALRGEGPSHEVIIEIAGRHEARGPGRYRYELVDPEGYASLSARGIAIVVESLLGLGGRPRPTRGLHFPETIVEPQAYLDRLQRLGTTVAAA